MASTLPPIPLDLAASLEPPSALDLEPRLSTSFPARLITTTFLGGLTGLALGMSHGSQTTALRFRAENAHRLPTTTKGWYLYHKTKNYHVLLGGLKEGAKMGGKLGGWVGAFFVIEEAVDRIRGKRDVGGSVVAGLSLAGGWAAWHRLPLVASARIAKLGLLSGCAYGLTQDAIGLLKGRRVDYVNTLTGSRYGSGED